MCSGHPKVHFGTIVEGSWGKGCTVGPPGSLTMTDICDNHGMLWTSSAIDSRASQIFSPVDATKPAVR